MDFGVKDIIDTIICFLKKSSEDPVINIRIHLVKLIKEISLKFESVSIS